MGLGEKAKEAANEHMKRKAARDILNAIGEWRGNRIRTARRRWIFELIQNAVDTAMERQNRSLDIEINSGASSFTFKHNGGHFTLDEINAVICGGSTKPYSSESDYLGRFGTGLLVTHIVNRKFDLKGHIRDEDGIHRFELAIDRDSDDETAIGQSIDDCYSQLERTALLEANSAEYWTEFTYCPDASHGLEAIKEGINQLKGNMPSIFAFNDIHEITINGERFQKRIDERQNCICVKVGANELYSKRDEEHGVQIGVLVNNGKVSDLANKPKIFVGMPLTETADYITVPFVINSVKFKPTKERDALSSDNEGKQQNEKLLQSSLNLYSELLCDIIKTGRVKGLFNLVKFQLIPETEYSQNPLWEEFNGFVRETFRQIIQNVRIVTTLDGAKELKSSCFPVDKLDGERIDRKTFDMFYKLVAEIKTNIPVIKERDSWMSVAEQLREVFPEDIPLYTVEHMRNDLQDFVGTQWPSFDDLGKRFGLSDARGFLTRFYKLVDSLYRQKLVSYDFIHQLLPAQDATIGPVTWIDNETSYHLYLEDSRLRHRIPDDLKDIAAEIGGDVRPDLVDNGFSKFKIVKKCVQDSMDIAKLLSDLLNDHALKPNEEIEDWEDNRVMGWMGLFRWCVTNNRLKPGFPVIAKDSKVQVLNELDEEALVIPFKYMQGTVEFEELYPTNRILHEEYFKTAGTQLKKFVASLRGYGAFVTSLPSYKKAVGFHYKKLESILAHKVKLSRGKHRVKAATAMIAILPFWETIIDKIQEYPDNAKLLLRFIIDYIMEKDRSWEHSINVRCSCRHKAHNIIPSRWLASLRTDKWVCYADKNAQGEEVISCMAASKESIERLFVGTEFSNLLRTHSDKLLRLLPYLGFDDLDLKVKLQSIETGESEEAVREYVSKLVDISNVVPDLADVASHDIDAFKETIQKLRQRLANKPIKDANRIVGKNVERIIKKIIEETEFGDKRFHVETTIYRGGDLEMWPVVTDGYDCGQVEIRDAKERKYTLEIKFTSGTRAHMSKAQSEMARDENEYYIVLVVHDNEDLRNKLIVDLDEGAIPDNVVIGVRENSHIITNIHLKLGNFPNPEEIEPDINGYWVKKKLWKSKVDVLQWLKTQFGSASQRKESVVLE